GGGRFSPILPQPLAVRVLDGQGQAFYDGEVDAAREEVVFLSLDLLQVEGRVRFAGHPVARASVSFVPPDPSYPPPQALESERDGSFEAWLVAGSYGVAVEAAGFCRRVFPLRVEEPPSLLDLSLDQACGTLVLRFAGRRMQELALFSQKFPHTLFALQGWAAAQGGEVGEGVWEIPALASGEYALCLLQTTPPGATASHCRQGFLPPAGRLILDLSLHTN
ncbi:MAG: hypothetical protein N2447_09380, partial [Thermoanaerobaculum sp.]|nr:hypothetical protein [Thermoanaerobaculum sp.]